MLLPHGRSTRIFFPLVCLICLPVCLLLFADTVLRQGLTLCPRQSLILASILPDRPPKCWDHRSHTLACLTCRDYRSHPLAWLTVLFTCSLPLSFKSCSEEYRRPWAFRSMLLTQERQRWLTAQEHLLLLQGALVQSPELKSGDSQLSLTPAPGGLMTSFWLPRTSAFGCTYSYTHTWKEKVSERL